MEPVHHDGVVEGVDVDAVAEAVRSCPAVVDLAAGSMPEFVTYLPGRRVPGVKVGHEAVGVQVLTAWGVPTVEVAEQIRRSVAPLVGHRRVDVIVADIADPDRA